MPTIGDGNCWFRTLSLHFDGIEDNYAQYKKEVYEYCKSNKEDLREFFVQDPLNNKDEVLENNDFDEYIEQISKNYFYSGNIEILISSQLYNLHIKLFIIENTKYFFFKKIAEIGEEYSANDMHVLFTNNIHYFFLSQKLI